MTGKNREDTGRQGGSSLGGILKGFADLVEKLSGLAEKGEELSRSGEFRAGGRGKELRGVYGFSIKVGLGGKGVRVEPFGNIQKGETTGESVVQETREPMVDVFEEEDGTLVVAEMPGIGAEDLQVDLTDDILTICAERGEKKYRKEILLSENFDPGKVKVSCHNGVVEIRCLKQ